MPIKKNSDMKIDVEVFDHKQYDCSVFLFFFSPMLFLLAIL